VPRREGEPGPASRAGGSGRAVRVRGCRRRTGADDERSVPGRRAAALERHVRGRRRRRERSPGRRARRHDRGTPDGRRTDSHCSRARPTRRGVHGESVLPGALMSTVDLTPAARRLADLVAGVGDDMLDAPTPNPAYTLGDLIDHIGGGGGAPPRPARQGRRERTGDASRLTDEWRLRIPRDLIGLAEAWRDPSAWTGMTRAGGVDLPGEVAGVVALDELVVHGWDVARATGQDYESDQPSLEAVHVFVTQFSEPGMEEARAGLFGPVVDVADDAPLLERVIGLTGRDPAWLPG